jgi:nuclease HARBI1
LEVIIVNRELLMENCKMAAFFDLFGDDYAAEVARINVNGAFRQRYRFSKTTFDFISNMLRDALERPTKRHQAFSVDVQVAIALRYYATGSFQLTVGDTLNVSQPGAFKILDKFSRTVDALLFDQFVKFPTDQEQLRGTKKKFLERAGFPNVIGAIDGCQIPILAPSDHEYAFVNRKGWHAINVQAVCDHQGRFTNLVVKWPGSTHDSFMLQNSELWNYMEGHPNIGYLLGDLAYPCRQWLMTPLKNVRTPGENAYNRAHKRTRVVIENAFGRLKRRFYCLGIPNRRDLENVMRDIRVCVTLHNIGVEQGDQMDDENVDSDDEDDDLPIFVNENGFARRARLIRNVFS